jgi:hypothetical protein
MKTLEESGVQNGDTLVFDIKIQGGGKRGRYTLNQQDINAKDTDAIVVKVVFDIKCDNFKKWVMKLNDEQLLSAQKVVQTYRNSPEKLGLNLCKLIPEMVAMEAEF